MTLNLSFALSTSVFACLMLVSSTALAQLETSGVEKDAVADASGDRVRRWTLDYYAPDVRSEAIKEVNKEERVLIVRMYGHRG
jgi:hypothetical protein